MKRIVPSFIVSDNDPSARDKLLDEYSLWCNTNTGTGYIWVKEDNVLKWREDDKATKACKKYLQE